METDMPGPVASVCSELGLLAEVRTEGKGRRPAVELLTQETTTAVAESRPYPFLSAVIRGKDAVASPLGQWTRVECICSRDRITIKINGVTVNECFDTRPSAGKILLQNEGNEIYYRRLELHRLKK